MPKGVYIKTEEHRRNLSKAMKGITKEMNPNLEGRKDKRKNKE